MKIIHTADLHIDSKLNANLSPEKAKQRRRELIDTFSYIADYATENEIGAVLICGDLFDRTSVTKLSRETVIDIFRTHPNVKFYYLNGNHDSNGFGAIDDLPENLFLFGNEWTYYELDGVTVAGCEDMTVKSRYAELSLDPSRKNIVMLHGEAVDGRTAVGVDRVVLKELKDRGIDYLALGHIHSYREGILDRRGVFCNSGVPAGRGFDECGVCGFVVIDTDEKKIKPQYIECPGRRFHTIEVDVSATETQPEVDNSVLSAVGGISCDDLVKVVMIGKCTPDSVRDVSHITELLNQKFYYAKVYDRTGILIDQKSTVGEVSLKGEFISTVLSEMPEGAERDMILEFGLRALGGEEL